MSNKPTLANAIAREHFREFTGEVFHHLNPSQTYRDNWHLGAIARKLEMAMRGELKRLIISLPPRHVKSTIASVAAPAFILGHNPAARILCVNYGEELATLLSGHTRSIMDAKWYRKLFPGTNIDKGKQTEDKIHTTLGGYRYAKPLFGPMTGMGGNFIICDDLIKANDVHSLALRDKAWIAFKESVMSRLDHPAEGVIILVMQRLHEDDHVARLKAQGGWTELVIPAETEIDREYDIGQAKPYVFKAGSVLDPNRMSKKDLVERRAALGASGDAAQYLQDPIAGGGTVFQWSWFKTYSALEEKTLIFDFVFHSWDVASSLGENASYSVCTRWGVVGDEKFYLRGVTRERLNMPDLVKKASRLYEKDEPDFVIVEKDGIGAALYQSLRKEYGIRIQGVSPDDAKVVRAEKVTPMIEQGRVYVPAEAPWLEAFRNEIAAFPNSKHDDQVDSMTQMLDYAGKAIRKAIQIGRRRQTEFEPDLAKYLPQITGGIIGGQRRLVSYS